MTAGIYLAGIVLTFLSMVCFTEGGLWVIAGLACAIGAILGAVALHIKDMEGEK